LRFKERMRGGTYSLVVVNEENSVPERSYVHASYTAPELYRRVPRPAHAFGSPTFVRPRFK
jgi:hypothetical protein